MARLEKEGGAGWIVLLAVPAAAVIGYLYRDDLPSWLFTSAPLVVIGLALLEFYPFLLVPAEKSVVAIRVRRELRDCFASSLEPPIEQVLAILEPAEDGAGVESYKGLTDRYFLGMIAKDEYYASMRRLLGVRVVGARDF